MHHGLQLNHPAELGAKTPHFTFDWVFNSLLCVNVLRQEILYPGWKPHYPEHNCQLDDVGSLNVYILANLPKVTSKNWKIFCLRKFGTACKHFAGKGFVKIRYVLGKNKVKLCSDVFWCKSGCTESGKDPRDSNTSNLRCTRTIELMLC